MIKDLSKQFWNEEDGAGLLEYLILAALAAVVAIFLFPGLRNVISEWFGNMVQNVNNALGGNTGGSNTNANGNNGATWDNKNY